MTLPLIVDLSVAILLVVTIVYAVALNRRLAGLRKDKAALEVAAASFEKATNRAGTGIAKLKTDSAELHEMMRTAQSLRDDLAFLIERGGSEADRLENVVRDARDHEDAPPPPARPPAGGTSRRAPRGEAARHREDRGDENRRDSSGPPLERRTGPAARHSDGAPGLVPHA